MEHHGIRDVVTAEEWRLVSLLREIPEGALREHTLRLIGEIVAGAREPRCARMQADGVPCADVGTACDQCVHVLATLAALTRAPTVYAARRAGSGRT